MEEPDIKKLSQSTKEPSTNFNQKERENAHGIFLFCICGRALLIIICTFVTLVALLALFTNYPSAALPSNYTQTCNTTEEFQNNLYKLTEKVHNLLDKQRIKHFLCYNSLWGAIENRGVLPWTDQVEICMEIEELTNKSMKFWIQEFGSAKLSIRYCWRYGMYTITDDDFIGGSVKLILFQEDPKTHNLMRSGWNYYRWNPDCRQDPSLHCFHPYLIDAPALRKRLFGEFKMPVPHFNDVIQRNLFPNTWREGSKGSMPKNC